MVVRTRAALVIAGSDSGGGAGIQADTWALRDLGVYAATAITAITAQDTRGVWRVDPLPPEAVVAQIAAVLGDLDVAVVKIGMVGSARLTIAIADALARVVGEVPIVLDPVMIATSGHRLLDEDAIGALVQRLVPMATVLTPNHPEAVALAGGVDVAAWAASVGRPVLVTGGDVEGEEIVDRLVVGDRTREWRGPRIAGGPFHGTGCTLASAVAAGLARGAALEDAVDVGIAYVRARLRAAIRPGHGSAVGGPVTTPWSATML
jgi:hydroxymethylpyrimidine/phosphomethylpyrimidine kinase